MCWCSRLLIGYGYVHNLFHGSEWGSNSFQQGAIQATLVSTAALPLPQDHPPTDNVLATETPSVAPALEEQKQEPLPLPEAVPIPEKQPPPKPAGQAATESSAAAPAAAQTAEQSKLWRSSAAQYSPRHGKQQQRQ